MQLQSPSTDISVLVFPPPTEGDSGSELKYFAQCKQTKWAELIWDPKYPQRALSNTDISGAGMRGESWHLIPPDFKDKRKRGPAPSQKEGPRHWETKWHYQGQTGHRQQRQEFKPRSQVSPLPPASSVWYSTSYTHTGPAKAQTIFLAKQTARSLLFPRHEGKDVQCYSETSYFHWRI